MNQESCLFECNETYVNTQRIHCFAQKWLSFFGETAPDSSIFDSCRFADECEACGFEMDCGKSFEQKYPEKCAFTTATGLTEIIHEIDDILLLGSAIFSQWRYYTHWAMSGLDNFKEWFLIAFTRLLELSEQKLTTSNKTN